MLGGRGDAGDNDQGASFVIIRRKDGKAVEMPATETTALQPGDIVKMFRPQDTGFTRQSTARRESRRRLPVTVVEGQ